MRTVRKLLRASIDIVALTQPRGALETPAHPVPSGIGAPTSSTRSPKTVVFVIRRLALNLPLPLTATLATRRSRRADGPAQSSRRDGRRPPGKVMEPERVTTLPFLRAESAIRMGIGTSARPSTVPAAFGCGVPGKYGVKSALQV